MTAIKTITLDCGVNIKDAIHRVESVTVGYKGKATYLVRVYKDLSMPAIPGEIRGEFEYSGGDVVSESYINFTSDGSYEEA